MTQNPYASALGSQPLQSLCGGMKPEPKKPGNAAVLTLLEGRQRVERALRDHKETLRRAQAAAENAKTGIRESEAEIAQIDCALAVLDAKVT